ncbi:MAG: thiol:disulfide interchange protein DsbA/DsbL [Pseudomonadota bacterium]
MNVLHTTALAAMALLVVASSTVLAQYEEGLHYERIGGPPIDATNDLVEVVEVFSYLCPHCSTFQPYVGPWEQALPENTSFRRVPVSFNPSWRAFAQAYYTAEVLGMLEQSHEALFTALHTNRQPIRSMSDLADFHAGFDVDADRFESTAESFAVQSRMRAGDADIAKWGVRSTPTLVINNKYRVSPRRGGTFEEVLAIADFLIEQELSALSPTSAAAATADADADAAISD